MLDSLYIKNYRNLKEFKIDSVDRINLITGKNNTGKSTLLEAIAIYANRGDFSLISQLLDHRGENFVRKNRRSEESEEAMGIAVRSLSAMFTNRTFDFDDEKTISIGDNKDGITFRIVKYYIENQVDEQGESIRRRVILNADSHEIHNDFKVGIEIKSRVESRLFPADRFIRGYGLIGLDGGKKFQFVRTADINRDTNGKLFDNIALTDKEQYVIEALQIIEPTAERIAFKLEDSIPRERTAVVKLSDNSEVLPLRSMGDGINRVLTIILALVNADNGFLLLDEFENGLHYSVQEQLWKIIFKLSKALNVQVFATTHSEDCISAFQRVLNSPGHSQDGKLIRLDNVNGDITAVEYTSRELQIADEQDIETR